MSWLFTDQFETQAEGELVEQTDPGESGQGWLARLVTAIDRAVEAGWPQTLRMIVLLAVTAVMLALVMMIIKQA